MNRYIDADALKQNLKENYTFYGFVDLLNDFYVAVDEMPSIDIVRCKECMFADVDAEAEMARCSLVSFPLWHRGDYFCADGERKESE